MLAGKWSLSILKYNYWLFRDKIQVQILSCEKKNEIYMLPELKFFQVS